MLRGPAGPHLKGFGIEMPVMLNPEGEGIPQRLPEVSEAFPMAGETRFGGFVFNDS